MYKLENGELIESPKHINLPHKIITNPSDEILRELGWMPLVESECPSYDQSCETLETYYIILDGVIHKRYKIIDIVPVEYEIAPESENQND